MLAKPDNAAANRPGSRGDGLLVLRARSCSRAAATSSGTRPARPACVVKEVRYKVNINTLHKLENDRDIGMNDIGRIRLRTAGAAVLRQLQAQPHTGSLDPDRRIHEQHGGGRDDPGAGAAPGRRRTDRSTWAGCECAAASACLIRRSHHAPAPVRAMSAEAPWRIWLAAAMRPRTLPAAVAPVIVGSALALARRGFDRAAAVICLAFALLVQIGANFANDYYDFVHGADTGERVGPRRAVAAGLVPPAAMRRAMWLTFGLAFAVGLALVAWGGWWLVAVGVASIASAHRLHRRAVSAWVPRARATFLSSSSSAWWRCARRSTCRPGRVSRARAAGGASRSALLTDQHPSGEQLSRCGDGREGRQAHAGRALRSALCARAVCRGACPGAGDSARAGRFMGLLQPRRRAVVGCRGRLLGFYAVSS